MSGAYSRSAKIIPMKGDVVIEPQSHKNTIHGSRAGQGRRAPGYPGESMPYIMQVELHGEAFDASFDPIMRNEIVRRVETSLRDKGVRFLMYEATISTYVEITDLEVIRREIFFALMNRKKNQSPLSSILNSRLDASGGMAAQHDRTSTAAAIRQTLIQHQQSPVPTAATLLNTDTAAAKRRLHQQQNARVARRKVEADIVDLTDDPEEEQEASTKSNAAASSYDSLMDRVTKHHKKQQQDLQQSGRAAGTPLTNRPPVLTPQEEQMLEAADMARQREAKIKAINLLREQTARQQEESLRRYEEVHQLSGQATGQQRQHAAAEARASELTAAAMLNPAGMVNNHAGLALNPYSAAATLLHQQQQARNFSSPFGGAGLSTMPPLGGAAGFAARNGIQQQFLNNTGASATTHLPASHAQTYAQHFFKPLKINDLPSKSTNEMSGWQFFPMNLEKDLKNLPLLNEWRIVVTPMSGNLDRSFTVDPSNVLPATGR